VANQHSPGPPLAARFWAKVNRDGPEHPALGRCWAWADSNRGGLLGPARLLMVTGWSVARGLGLIRAAA
jgi:hypothetical protein